MLSGNEWRDNGGETGTYSVSDGTITFYYAFDGETEELFDGTISDGVIYIADLECYYCKDGKTPSGNSDSSGNSDEQTEMQYTVMYDANGGTFVGGETTLTATEKNNSMLTAPDSPTRTNYTFAGWAKNISGSDKWNFTEDIVTKNLTLYAIWLPEISVTLDANGGVFTEYRNQLEIVVTEGSLLTDIETPTRDGYDFMGWYKNSELTELWTFETDTVSSATTLYAGWELDIVEREVTYVHNYDDVENVVQTTIEGLVTYIPTRSGYIFNGWWISDGQTASGEYILAQKWDTTEIVSVNNLVLYAEWVEASTVSSQLPAPSVSINDNVFSWSAVTNAVRYDVRVYASGSNEELENDSVSGTSWTFPNGYDAGYYTVKIRAIGDGLNTVNSVYVSKSYSHLILSGVSKIDFDISTSILTWSPVKNATAYELYINNKLVEELTYAAYDMSDYEAGNYTIRIVATRDNYQSSSASRTIEKLRLKTPELDVFVEKDTGYYTLLWSSVNHADTYILLINGEEIRVTEGNSYRFNNSASFWKENNTISFTMTAFDSGADYLVSIATSEITKNKLYQLTLDKNTDQGILSTNGDIYVPQTFTVTFDLNGASGTVDSQTITATNSIDYPSIPMRTGYVFRGWYVDESCTEVYDFTQVIDRNITLYAGWYAIQTEGYENYVIDVTSNYNSSSNAYNYSMSSTSSSNAKYVYFGALTTGTYTLYYKNSSSTSSYGTYLYVYNATKKSTIKSNSKITSTSYTSLSMSLTAGDVVYICNYRYNTSYSPTFYFYITGAAMPSDGGVCDNTYFVKETEAISTQENTYIECNEEITITATATDNRYIFDGWYNGGKKLTGELTYTFTMPLENVHYTARWIECPVVVKKNYDNAGSIIGLDNATKVGETITITATTNDGYTWLGWYNGDVELTKELSYTFTISTENVVYTAKWAYYTVTIDKNYDDAGTVSSYNNTKVTAGESITITAQTNNGYTWVGWYNNETELTKDLSYTFEMPAESVTYTAKWAYYTVTVDKNYDDAGTVSSYNNTKVTVGESITITAQTNNGYTWVGWYNDETELTKDLSYTFEMPAESVTYTAKWCKVTLEKNGVHAGTVKGLDNVYKVGDEVTISATTNIGYTWVGWYNGETELTKDLSYTFEMPAESVTYTAKWSVNICYINNDGNFTEYVGVDIEYLTTANSRTLTGWYVLKGTVSGNFSLTVSGEAHIILMDGCNWTIDKLLVAEGNTLNIYAQSNENNSGKLTVKSTIGGENGSTGTNGTSGKNGNTSSNPFRPTSGGSGSSGTSGQNAGIIIINGGVISANHIGGGNGGAGGKGGTGGKGYLSDPFSNTIEPGADGGKGGNGGNGGILVIKGGSVSVNSIGCGAGGTGGTGGTGGLDSNDASYDGNGGSSGGNGSYNLIYFYGTQSEWSQKGITATYAIVYFYSTTEPNESGNFWHYDTDGETIIEW